MTVHANSLTERVSQRADTVGTTWTAPANDLRVLTDALGRLGYDVDALPASAGLGDTALTDLMAQNRRMRA